MILWVKESMYLSSADMCIYMSSHVLVCAAVYCSLHWGLWVTQASSSQAHLKPLDKPCVVHVL